MTEPISPDDTDPPGGFGGRAGPVGREQGWAVGTSRGAPFAVSRRCRHHFADLGRGTVDADGCLVCPWHASRYDVRTGAMVSGPKGFLGWHGPTPGYTQAVLAVGRRWRLRVRDRPDRT